MSRMTYFDETSKKLNGHTATGLTQVFRDNYIITIIQEFVRFFYKLILLLYKVRLVSLAGKQLDYCVFQCFTSAMSTMDIYSVIIKSLLIKRLLTIVLL